MVDALDLCYTKSHVNTFVIISGDSDFSPLVSKLRENDKKVIGVGVKQSTSDLLIANCDEFIFYDDLAREGQRAAESRRDSRDSRGAGGGQRRTPEEERRRKEEQEARKTQAVELVVETFDALMAERGDGDRIWASVLKDSAQAAQARFQRVLLRLPRLRQPAGRGAVARLPGRGPRGKVGHLCVPRQRPWPSGAAPGRARRGLAAGG